MSSKYSISITPNQILFPEHTLGEWTNPYAFAAIKADGSVVTWGVSSAGGDSSAVAVKLTGAPGFFAKAKMGSIRF